MKIKKKNKFNFSLFFNVILLIFLGIVILASSSAPFSQEKFGDPFYLLKKQIIFALIPGFFICFIFYKIPLSFLRKYAFLIFLANLIILALVFLPKIGEKIGGARRWISLGPFSFQPSEFLKISFIIYFSAWMTSKEKGKELLIGFLLISAILSIFLIFQPDISTLGVIIFVSFLIYFASETPLWHNILIIILGIGVLLLLIKLAPYRMARFTLFLNPNLDPLGIGYQLKQSLIAIGSGGMRGLGFGLSRQKFGFLPSPFSDAIFAVFCEETGFLGSFILISLYVFFLYQGIKIVKSLKEDLFLKLVSLGIVSWIVLQAFINMGSITGILPLTGIPLPFISYGGSAFLAEMIGIGILLNISKKI